MKKLILLAVLILISAAGFSAELTADSVAVEPSMWAKLIAGIMGLIGMAFGALFLEIRKFIQGDMRNLIASWLKSHLHFRGADVVSDAIAEELTFAADDLSLKLLDGKLSKAEVIDFKAKIHARVKPRLVNLAGFYKKDLDAWIDEQIGIQLGKFLFLNSSGSGSKTP